MLERWRCSNLKGFPPLFYHLRRVFKKMVRAVQKGLLLEKNIYEGLLTVSPWMPEYRWFSARSHPSASIWHKPVGFIYAHAFPASVQRFFCAHALMARTQCALPSAMASFRTGWSWQAVARRASQFRHRWLEEQNYAELHCSSVVTDTSLYCHPCLHSSTALLPVKKIWIWTRHPVRKWRSSSQIFRYSASTL